MKRNNTTCITSSGRFRTCLHTGLRRSLAGMAALALCVPNSAPANPKASAPYSKIVSFGDSLSDIGNFFAATGVPPFPYWEGRVSDGPIWLEYLSAKLCIPFDHADQYGWLGSTTGDTNFRDMPEAGVFFPGFEQQIDLFLSEVGEDGADPEALYSVWIGANDFFDWLVKQDRTPEELIADGVANTLAGIIALHQAGACHFIVGNVPDLGITPDGMALGPFISATLSQLSLAYNQALEQQLALLEDALGIYVTRLDAYDIVNQLTTHPELFGFINTTDEAIASFPDVNPSEYVFWDGVHPTTASHEWVADFVCAALVRTYAPRGAKGQGPTSPRALHGLVRSATVRK